MRAFGMIPSPPDERDFSLGKAVAYATAPITERMVSYAPDAPNQGGSSMCAAVTLAGIIEAVENKQRGEPVPISMKFIYGNRRDTDFQGEGMIPREALQNATRFGAVRLAELPGFSTFDAAKQAALSPSLDGEGFPNRIKGYVRLSGLQDVSDYMALYDLPVFFGMWVTPSFMTCTGIAPKPDGQVLGGHAMRCVGIKSINGRWHLVVRNSWGPTWGASGTAYICLEDGHQGVEMWGVIPENSGDLISRPQEILLTIGSTTAWVDGQQMALPKAPFITPDGFTVVPLRFVSEALKGKVDFYSMPGGGRVLLRWGGEQ